MHFQLAILGIIIILIITLFIFRIKKNRETFLQPENPDLSLKEEDELKRPNAPSLVSTKFFNNSIFDKINNLPPITQDAPEKIFLKDSRIKCRNTNRRDTYSSPEGQDFIYN